LHFVLQELDMPGLTLRKKAGAVWKALGSDEKQLYEEKTKEDKQRYEQEMKPFKAEEGGAAAMTS
jgi:hypothetical protein